MGTTAQAEISHPTRQEPLQIGILSNEPSHGKIGQTLEQLGYTSNLTSDPQEALAQIAGAKSCVTLCDADFPSMDGLKFLAEALRLNPSTKVILMTDSYSPDAAVQAIQCGAYDYLPKPVERSRLKKTLENIGEQTARKQRVCRLKRQLVRELDFHGIVGDGPGMLGVFDEAMRLACRYASMLLTGPSGAGKALLARAIHQMSPVANQRFVVCNCIAPAEGPLENRLFGRGRGASTGTRVEEKPALLEYANGGTLYLDEAGELPLAAQAKLLRVITDHEIRSSISSESRRVDVRIIAGTTRDLRTEVLAGRFREDFFLRLEAAHIRIPSLAERREDIPLLVDFFLLRYNTSYHKDIQGATPRAMGALLQYGWPGNVRELENVISAAALADLRGLIDWNDLPENVRRPPKKGTSENGWQPLRLREVRKDHIERVLELCNGNRVRAAQLLGIGRTSLYRYLKRRTKGRPTEDIRST